VIGVSDPHKVSDPTAEGRDMMETETQEPEPQPEPQPEPPQEPEQPQQ
jgi:hypothetical protein